MAEYQFGYTGAKMNELFGKITPLETAVNNINTAFTKIFTNINVATSAWAADTTYTDYPYRATITLTGISSSHYCDIVFSATDAVSGKFAPVCESTTNGVYIYASAIPADTIIIPTIKCVKTL